MPDSEVGRLVNQSSPADAVEGQPKTSTSQSVSEASQEKALETTAVSIQPPEYPSGERGSRPRPAKSCERCREKKLKCDRELPCNNCTKSHRDGNGCHYKTGPNGEIEMSWTMDGKRVNQREIQKTMKRKRSEDPATAPLPSLQQVNQPELPQGPQQGSAQIVATVWDSQSKTFRDVPPQTQQNNPERGLHGHHYTMGPPESTYPPHGLRPPGSNYAPGLALPNYAPPGLQYPPPPPGNYYSSPGGQYPLPPNDHHYEAPAPAVLLPPPRNLPSLMTPTSSMILHEPPLSRLEGSATTSIKASPKDVDNQQCKLGKLHVMNTRSRYLGLGDKMAMMDLFEGPKKFIWCGAKDPEISNMMHECMTFGMTYNSKGKVTVDVLLTGDALDAEMFQALPSKFLIRILTAKYMQNWETIYRVLHIPTFKKECDAILSIRDTQDGWPLPEDIGSWVIPQILMVLAISCRLCDPSERSQTRERISDDQVSKYIQMVQRWLDGIQGRAKADFHNLQTQTLLQIARQVNLTMPTLLWKQSGALLRTAMIMGLHFDSESSTALSKISKEMRRKLWITIVELDAHCSLAAGMPPALHQWAINPAAGVLNVEDEDLKNDMVAYPDEKPKSTWTSASPQIALWTSMRDRLDAINWLGGIRYTSKSGVLSNDAATILHYARMIEHSFKTLPPPFRPSTRQGIAASKRATRLYNSIMVDMSMRRPLFSLYRVVALSQHSTSHPQAREGVLAQSLAILSYLDALDPGVADPNIIKDKAYLNLFHITCKHDIMQTAMMICMEIWGLNQEKEHEDDGPTPQESLAQSKHRLTRIVEITLQGLIDRLGEFGNDMKDVIQLSVVLQSVRSNGTPAEKRALMIKGAERVLMKAREVLPQIQDPQYQKRFRNRQRGGKGCGRGGTSGLAERVGEVTPASVSSTAATPVAEASQSASRFWPISFDEFNTLPDSEYDLGDFDFSSIDWDMGQSWL